MQLGHLLENKLMSNYSTIVNYNIGEPTVSVIIPIYGVERYIKRCVDSLFMQTLGNCEFIFVNDGTKDSSMFIIDETIKNYKLSLEKKHQSVHIVCHEHNLGLPQARISGLSIATGKYIAHCDGDDWIEADMYELMYKQAKSLDSDVVICDYFKTGNSCDIRVKQDFIPNTITFMQLMLIQKNSWSVWNKLVNRDLYKLESLLRPVPNMGEDLVFTIQLIYNAKKISYVDNALYHYCINDDSICRVQTKESYLDRFYQAVSNVNIVKEFLKLDSRFDDSIKYLVSSTGVLLLPIIKYPDVYSIWRDYTSDVNVDVLFNRKVSFKHKINLLRMYVYSLLRYVRK